MSAPPGKPIDEALRDRAVTWHVRLGSDAAVEDDWLAFEAWLAESPTHLRAYEAVEALWAELDEVAAAPATNIVPLKPRPSRRLATWIGLIAASLIAAIVIGVGFWPDQPPTRTFQTALGERQAIALADGSRVTLNGGSRIAATIGARERRVVMADAEAAFDVAKDPARPFVIEAGDREIRVVGTEFNVLRHDGEVRVTVRRGIVEVRPAGASGATALARLSPGQSLAHREGQQGDNVSAADPEAAFAWTEGRLIFRGERLEEVARTLNRYVRTPIIVAPDARDVRVTAVLNLGPEDQLLQSLTAFLPVHAERQGDSVRLSLRQAAR
jgi:transmembrane sensor